MKKCLWLLALIGTSCSKTSPSTTSAVQTPRSRVVYLVVTPTPSQRREAEPAWTPEPEEPTPQSATISVALPTPRPTVDIAAIPNFDRPVPPVVTPKSRSDQLAGCLTYAVEPSPGGQWYRVKVTGRNRCSAVVTADESWFEVTAFDWNGHEVGRQVGHFQGAISPDSFGAETYIEVDCPKGPCRYTAAVWWAAGGGRKPE